MTFEGVRGNTWQGDIAIDDVSLRPGSCSGLPPSPPPPQTPASPVGGRVDVSVLPYSYIDSFCPSTNHLMKAFLCNPIQSARERRTK